MFLLDSTHTFIYLVLISLTPDARVVFHPLVGALQKVAMGRSTAVVTVVFVVISKIIVELIGKTTRFIFQQRR